METKIVQVRGRGTVTLPARMRQRYGLADGDPLTLIDLDGLILLAPRVGMVPKLAAEIERLRVEQGLSVEDLLGGMREHRASKPSKRSSGR